MTKSSSLFFCSMVTLVFVIVSLSLFLVTSTSSLIESGMLSPVESGFESLRNKSSNISSPFFFSAALFILFDLELLLLVPAISFNLKLVSWIFIISFFLLTFFLEWEVSGLKWNH